MKPKDIYVGRTYRNRGKGTTRRKVLRIEKGLACNWYSTRQRPDEPVVEYEQGGCASRLYLSSFAAWAGFDDTPEDAMSNDNTPQRPWSPGPWTQDGDNVMAPRGYVVCHCGGPRKEARARAIATFPELYEAAAAYREAVVDYYDSTDRYRDKFDALEYAAARLDAALAAALPPEDETP